MNKSIEQIMQNSDDTAADISEKWSIHRPYVPQ